jgi:hypothetical protein
VKTRVFAPDSYEPPFVTWQRQASAGRVCRAVVLEPDVAHQLHRRTWEPVEEAAWLVGEIDVAAG